jgi:hypothetical protein
MYLPQRECFAVPSGIFFWSEIQTGVVVGMLPKPYCPDELLASGTLESVYGMVAGYSAPLTFWQAENGTVSLSPTCWALV